MTSNAPQQVCRHFFILVRFRKVWFLSLFTVYKASCTTLPMLKFRVQDRCKQFKITLDKLFDIENRQHNILLITCIRK